jgi:RNA polymerase sigma-70 factor (ECF subfamily)
LSRQDNEVEFERLVVPHLGAAYNLARWLTRNSDDAEDVVQDACVRAVKFLGGYRGGDPKSWLLKIVRNAGMDLLRRKSGQQETVEYEEDVHGISETRPGPRGQMIERESTVVLRTAIQELPAEFREAVILRELEELSYKEIADVLDLPIGTVMSRLARGRKRLQEILSTRLGEEYWRNV